MARLWLQDLRHDLREERSGAAGLCNNGAYADSLVMEVSDALLGIPASQASPTVLRGTAVERKRIVAICGFLSRPQLALPRVVTLRDGALHMVGDVVEHILRPVAANRFQASGVKGEFEFAAPLGESGVSPRFRQLHPSLSSGTSRFERIVVAQPSAERLRDFEGRYYSAELDTLYVAAIVDGQLTMSGGRDRPCDPNAGASARASCWTMSSCPSKAASSRSLFATSDKQSAASKASAQFGWVRDIEFVRVE